MLSALTNGQNVSPQKITAGNMAHFINGIRRPLGFLLLSLMEAIKGSKTASTSLPEDKITGRIFNTPNSSNCGINGVNPELDGGK